MIFLENYNLKLTLYLVTNSTHVNRVERKLFCTGHVKIMWVMGQTQLITASHFNIVENKMP